MNRKAILGAFIASATTILLMSVFITPWYTISLNGSNSSFGIDYGVEGNIDVYLTHEERYVVVEVGGMNQTQLDTEELDPGSPTGKVVGSTAILAILTVTFSAVSLIAALLVAFGKINPKLGGLLVLPVLIFAFLTPLYFMIALPPAIGEEAETSMDSNIEVPNSTVEKISTRFFGSDTANLGGGFVSLSVNITWGGAIAWFMSLIAGLLSLITMTLIFTSKPKEVCLYGQHFQDSCLYNP